VRVFSALLKRTASITQAGIGSQAVRSRTIAFFYYRFFYYRFDTCYSSSLHHRSHVHICINKINYRQVSRLGEHSTQGTSTPWVEKQGNYRICL